MPIDSPEGAAGVCWQCGKETSRQMVVNGKCSACGAELTLGATPVRHHLMRDILVGINKDPRKGTTLR